MNINEFEKTLLTNKITPVELSSDDLHRTKIINKWTKTDEDRAWMFFETICRIAVPIFVSFQIIQIVFFMLLSGKDFILGIMQVMLCAALDATVLFFLSIFTYGFLIIKAYISFRPEIAKRLELDSLEKWQNYIKFHIETLMRGYDIPKDRFEYIAAVHDKKGQPHIHISFWDKDPPVTVQFVKKEVSDNVRKKLIHDTFANELSYYYGISNEAMSDAKELVGKLMIDFERDISGIYSNRFSGVDIPEELIQKYTDVLNNLPRRGRIAYAYLPKETKDMVIGMIKGMIMLPKMKSIINDYYSGARSAAEMFDSKETDNGKSEIDRKMRKAAGDLYNRLGNIILKSMLRTLKENNEQRKKDNAEINTKITVDSMVYALNAVSRLFRTQGSAGTVNTAHALIGELSKQAKKDIARQKQDKGHEV